MLHELHGGKGNHSVLASNKHGRHSAISGAREEKS